MNQKKLTIALDGHSSCGKSTFAKKIAAQLVYKYIDSGAMYRCVTLYAIEKEILKNGSIDEDRLRKQMDEIKIDFIFSPETQKNETFLNGKSVEDAIRSLEVSQHVSDISKLKFVREKLVEMQRSIGASGGIVMDGRDIGTVVFPSAELKIFMTARPEVRADRRYKELTAKGEKVSFDEILFNLNERDRIDSSRIESPLKIADDALILDNSDMSVEQQMEWVMERIKPLTL